MSRMLPFHFPASVLSLAVHASSVQDRRLFIIMIIDCF